MESGSGHRTSPTAPSTSTHGRSRTWGCIWVRQPRACRPTLTRALSALRGIRSEPLEPVFQLLGRKFRGLLTIRLHRRLPRAPQSAEKNLRRNPPDSLGARHVADVFLI